MRNTFLSIQRNAVFFLGFTVMLLAGIILLLVKGKAGSFIFFNTYHVSWLNNFFIIYTFAGHGVFIICLAAIYLFLIKKKREALIIFYSFLFSGILVQIVKHIFFSPRPKSFFNDSYHCYFIEGIKFCYNNSFPSGHTTTAFAVTTVLVLLSRSAKVQLPLLLAALLVGFSRIYLGQHFLLDVLVGGSLGIVSGILCVHIALNQKRIQRYFRQLFILKRQTAVTSPGSI
jgi:membrane-associated phospholipid phosphatase